MKQQTQKIIPITQGKIHLQNEIINDKCYICKDKVTDDSVLIRRNGNEMVFACTRHKGIVQEFIRQFKIPPLGWSLEQTEETNNA